MELKFGVVAEDVWTWTDCKFELRIPTTRSRIHVCLYHFFAAANRQNLRFCLCHESDSNWGTFCSWHQNSQAELWLQPNVLRLCIKCNEVKQSAGCPFLCSVCNVHTRYVSNVIFYATHGQMCGVSLTPSAEDKLAGPIESAVIEHLLRQRWGTRAARRAQECDPRTLLTK